MNDRERTLSPRLAMVAICFACAASSHAQDSTTIDEIFVTAQRVEENILEVPIAITAIDGLILDDAGVITPSDIQMNVPGMTFTADNFGGANFSIRGIGNLITLGSGDAGVSVHINQIPITPNLSTTEMYDMERVEVLRGPQGTLYGRNATGGVINFVTTLPDTQSTNGYVEAEVGSFNNQRIKAALNLRLGNNFALRMAGMSLDRDGYVDNLAANQVGTDGSTLTGLDDDVDGRNLTSLRITGLWEISDIAEAWLMYQNFSEDDDRLLVSNQVCVTNPIPTTGCLPNEFGFEPINLLTSTNGLLLGAVVGGLPLASSAPSKFPRPANLGFRQMHTDVQPRYMEDEDLLGFGLKFEIPNHRVEFNGALQEREFLSIQDFQMDVGETLFDGTVDLPVSELTSNPWSGPCNYLDGTAGLPGGCAYPADGTVQFVYAHASLQTDYWTIEGRVLSEPGSRIGYMFGVNAYEGERSSGYAVAGNGLDAAGAYPGYFNNTIDPAQPSVSEGWAGFGELYYQYSDDLKFTLGLRYNNDERSDFSTSIFLDSFDLDAALGGALGGTTFVRAALVNFLGGAPLGDQTDLASLYGVDAATITSAEATGPFSPERIGVAVAIPSVPLPAETRFLTNSPTRFEFDEWSGRIGFDWQFKEGSLLYGFFSRGYKPGGLNPAIPTAFQDRSSFSYLPERINAFEIGTKNSLLDNSLMLNAAVFAYDYVDLQTTRVVNNTSLNENIDADVLGFEIEGVWQFSNLRINGAYSFTGTDVDGSSSIDPVNRTAGDDDWILFNDLGPGATTGTNFIAQRDQVNQAVINGCVGLGAAIPIPDISYPDGTPALWARGCLEAFGVTTLDGLPSNLDGNELPNTPEHTIVVGAEYPMNVPAVNGDLILRWDFYWQSDSFAREFNIPGDAIDSWSQHNLQLIYESENGLWSARAFVRNLGDEDNVTGHYLTSDTAGFFRNYFLTEPRIYGLSVRYNFSR